MKTEHQLGQLPGKDTCGLSPTAEAIVQTSRNHFNPTLYGDHAELLGVGATFPHPYVNEGVEYAK